MTDDDEINKVLMECVDKVYTDYSRLLNDLERCVYDFKEMGPKIKQLKDPYYTPISRNRIYMKKDRNDPFDLIYIVGVKIRYSSLRNIFNKCFKTHNIDYDLDIHKDEIVHLLETYFSKKTDLKIRLTKLVGHVHIDTQLILNSPSYIIEM